MTKVDKTIVYALLLCTAAIPLVASAADASTAMHSGFQFGLGIGQGDLQLSTPDTPESLDLHAFAYNLFVGYRISQHAAVEASYIDAGSMSSSLGQGASFNTRPHMATATGLGNLPLNETFSLFARAGLAHWWYNADLNFEGMPSKSFGKKSNQLIWGIGASAFVDGGLLRLEYAQSKSNTNFDELAVTARLRVISLSVVWMP